MLDTTHGYEATLRAESVARRKRLNVGRVQPSPAPLPSSDGHLRLIAEPEGSGGTIEWLSAQDAIPNDRHGVPVFGAPRGLNKVMTILNAASKYFRMPVVEILSQRHHARLVRPRHIAMYLSHELTTLPYPVIGRLMDNRDHSTIMNGVSRIRDKIVLDPQLAADVETVKALAIAADPGLGS